MPTAAELRAAIQAHKQRAANPPPPVQPALTAHGKPGKKDKGKGKPGNGPGKPQEAKKPKKPPRSPLGRDRDMAKKGRLPKGSEIAGHWDGEKWSGRLGVALDSPDQLPPIFTAESPGLFSLLAGLDDQYRKWLWHQEQAAKHTGGQPVIEEPKPEEAKT